MFGKKRKPNFFDQEEARIQQEMANLDVNSQEYKDRMADLKTMISLRSDHKASKSRLDKRDKGALFVKGVGVVGILAALGITATFEKQGNTFTGENRRWVDTLVSNLGRFNLFG